MDFEQAMSQLNIPGHKRVAVAAAEDDVVLKAVVEGHRRGLVEPILCGDKPAIEKLARELDLDISKFELVATSSTAESARAAVGLAREGKADILMKGLIQTADFLRAVLDKEHGVRGKGILSHCNIVQSPILNRVILLTDAAMIPYPDLKTKVKIIENALIVAKGVGMENPKIAPLAAVEVVNPDMPATLDAAALTVMNQRGQIKGCVIDGPLAMDLALSAEAVRHKGIKSEVAGRADILLFHNIEAANNTMKALIYGGNCLAAGIVLGAACPIVITSRADSDQAKLYSIACAASITLGK